MNALRGASESLFGTGVKLSIRFADAEARKTVSVKVGDKRSEQLLFGPHDAVRGKVHIDPPGGRRLEHTGVRLELIGQIESLLDRTVHEFTSLVRELVRLSTRTKHAAPFSGPEPEPRHCHWVGFNNYKALDASVPHAQKLWRLRAHSTQHSTQGCLRLTISRCSQPILSNPTFFPASPRERMQ